MYIGAQGGPILHSMMSSIFYSFVTVLLAFFVCILPASVFARHSFRFKILLEALLLAPALVPAITFSMGIHYVFILVGIADTTPGVVVVLTIFSYPYMLRALTAGFVANGEGYGTCAENLGAGLTTRMLRVELPLLLPAIISGGTVVFLIAFSEYFLVFLIGGGSVPSFTGYLFPFLSSADRSVASCLTLLFMVVPILLLVSIDLGVHYMHRKNGLVVET